MWEFIVFCIVFVYVYTLSKRVNKLERLADVMKRRESVSTFIEERSVKTVTSPQESSGALVSPDPELLKFITRKYAVGKSYKEISTMLLSVGWAQMDVESAIRFAMTNEGLSKDDIDTEKTPGVIAQFLHWLATDWLMKLGAFLLLVAFAWFITYAFTNNWIGPNGRITLGVILGVSVMLVGEWRIKSYKNQGAVFFALGASAVLMTIYAGQFFYNMFTPVTALGLMFIVVLYLALTSVRYKNKSLAVLSLVLGYLIPVLLGDSSVDYLMRFYYILLVSIGTFIIVAVTGWRMLLPLSLTGVFIYSMYIWDDLKQGTTLMNQMLTFGYMFTALYFATGVSAIVRTKKAFKSDLLVAAATGMFVLLWIMFAVTDVWQSLVTAGWAFFFAVGAFMVYAQTRLKAPFFIYGGVAATLIGVATAFELDGASLIIAFILEVALVVFLTQVLLNNYKTTLYTSLLFIVPIMGSFESLEDYRWRERIPFDHFSVLFLLMFILFGLAFYLFSISKKENEDEFFMGVTPMFVISTLYGLSLLWLVPYSLFEHAGAVTISLTIYTLIGITSYLYGKKNDIQAFVYSGSALLGFVVFRLLGFEVWMMELSGRIIVFAIIGVLLMSTAFIGRKKEGNIKSIS